LDLKFGKKKPDGFAVKRGMCLATEFYKKMAEHKSRN